MTSDQHPKDCPYHDPDFGCSGIICPDPHTGKPPCIDPEYRVVQGLFELLGNVPDREVSEAEADAILYFSKEENL